MSGAGGALRELRQLGQAAAVADDAAVARLVAMLDRLPDRGEADRVLDPVRPRLRALGLKRPLGLPRLLFLPLDGAILPPSRWSRGAPAVPRSALPMLAAASMMRRRRPAQPPSTAPLMRAARACTPQRRPCRRPG